MYLLLSFRLLGESGKCRALSIIDQTINASKHYFSTLEGKARERGD